MEDLVVGLIAVAISAIFYGSNFVAIKPYDTRDGFFIYWVQSIALFVEGFVVNWIQNFPKFTWYGAAAGALWATGNVVAVPIVNVIGMGLGILLWSSAQICVGWAIPRFGLFGLDAQEPHNRTMEMFGILITLASGGMFAMVRSTVVNEIEEVDEVGNSTDIETHPDYLSEQMKVYTLPHQFLDENSEEMKVEDDLYEENTSNKGGSKISNMIETIKYMEKTKLLAVVGAIGSGLLYGLQMSPVTYAETKVKGESNEGLDYVYSHNVGVLLTCTFWFLLYCIIKRNKPYVNPQTILPGLMYGLMWVLATTAWFISDDKLSQAVSYPLTARVPGVIAALWSVFYFREIKGKRDLILMVLAIITALVGVLLVGLAKVV